MKIFTKLISSLLLGFATLYGNAAEKGVDLTNYLGAITPGTSYSLTAFGDYYSLISGENGSITVQTNYTGSIDNLVFTNENNSYFIFYSYWDFYMQQPVASYRMVENEGWQFIVNVKKGTEYVFGYTDLIKSVGPMDFTVTLGNDVEIPAALTYCYPTAGTYYDPALGINDITLEFDQAVLSVSSITLNYTDKEGNPQKIAVPKGGNGYELHQKLLIIRIANTNNVFYTAKQNADPNYPFYIEIDDLMCGAGPVTNVDMEAGNDYVTIDGNNLFLQYNFEDNVMLIDYSFPQTFYSYWSPGDVNGMATLTFNAPVDMKWATISLIMGEHYRGSVSSGDEPDPFYAPKWRLNEDKTIVTIDFTGVDYAAKNEKEYSEVTVMVSGIRGENRLMVGMTGGTGSNPIISNNLDQIFPYVDEAFGSVESLNADSSNNKIIYNLQGQKVTDPVKGGIYIINGKKVVVK